MKSNGSSGRVENGFTLVELMLVAALTVLLALLIGVIFQKGQNLFDVNSAESNIQRNGRRALQSVSVSIRKARKSTITIPAQPNNNQITLDIPIFRSGTSCSAFASVAQGTSPETCSNGADCDNQCSNAPGTNVCINNICRRSYTYSIVTANGAPQLVVATPSEPNIVAGNQIQSVVFRDNTMDPNLNSDEIRINLTTQGNVVTEKRTHTLTLSNIVKVRN